MTKVSTFRRLKRYSQPLEQERGFSSVLSNRGEASADLLDWLLLSRSASYR